jgi:hypothetical protein
MELNLSISITKPTEDYSNKISPGKNSSSSIQQFVTQYSSSPIGAYQSDYSITEDLSQPTSFCVEKMPPKIKLVEESNIGLLEETTHLARDLAKISESNPDSLKKLLKNLRMIVGSMEESNPYKESLLKDDRALYDLLFSLQTTFIRSEEEKILITALVIALSKASNMNLQKKRLEKIALCFDRILGTSRGIFSTKSDRSPMEQNLDKPLREGVSLKEFEDHIQCLRNQPLPSEQQDIQSIKTFLSQAEDRFFYLPIFNRKNNPRSFTELEGPKEK